MSHSDSHTEQHFARTIGAKQSRAPIGALVSFLILILGFIFFNVVEVSWISTKWKIFLTVFSAISIGLAILIVGHRMAVKRDARIAARKRSEKALIKERELVKFQATKAWPRK
jgi:protein-S-isoprenylcysteine O-methyltransferase Ste14